jgi:hypothetical protein
MIGNKLYKQDLNITEYENTSAWCNKNNAMLIDKGEYFEVATCPDFTKEQIPSLDERIAVLEEAVNTLMEGGATNG